MSWIERCTSAVNVRALFLLFAYSFKRQTRRHIPAAAGSGYQDWDTLLGLLKAAIDAGLDVNTRSHDGVSVLALVRGREGGGELMNRVGDLLEVIRFCRVLDPVHS